MANRRRRRRRIEQQTIRQRVFKMNPSPRLLPMQTLALEDRRLYHPSRTIQPPRGVVRSDARLVAPLRNKQLHQINFARPAGVSLCARRKQRREVIFATKKQRKGAGARTRRRNEWSNVKC